MSGRSKNTKNMTTSEEATAYTLAYESKWSYRRIGRQLGRSDKAIAAAVARYEARLKHPRSGDFQIDHGLLTDDQIAQLEHFCAWVEEGRKMGWSRLLLAGMGPVEFARSMAPAS